MDIFLEGTGNAARIMAKSIHGMLWLQTHFEDSYWEAIASGLVTLSLVDSHSLSEDARKAGLRVNLIQQLSIADKC